MFFTRADGRHRNLLAAGFASELVASGGDAFAGLYRGQEGTLAWVMVHAGNYATFIGNFLLVGVLTRYLCTRVRESGGPEYPVWCNVVQISAGVMCALTLLGVFFSIDEQNLYSRTDLYGFALAYVLTVNAVNAVLLIRVRRGLGATAFRCLLFYTLAPIAASLIQAFVYGLNFAIVAAILALVVLFFEMQQHASQILVEQAEELARSRVEVSESRIAVMVSQIQPHFLFNTLDTIYGLVDEDKEKAKEAIASFSRYLRANLASLKHAKPVPIEREMEHVKTYLELERMSDEGRLTYELDVRAIGFRVPALSVQTLAENAVKHGLGARENGGKLFIRTREQAGEYTVAIVDNGVGFDVESLDSAVGIGLANTRARLSAMCGGELEVHSKQGVGTAVVLHVPKDAGKGARV